MFQVIDATRCQECIRRRKLRIGIPLGTGYGTAAVGAIVEAAHASRRQLTFEHEQSTPAQNPDLHHEAVNELIRRGRSAFDRGDR